MHTDALVGVPQFITNFRRRQSIQKGHEGEFYYDVQAITNDGRLLRYSTGSKYLMEYLQPHEAVANIPGADDSWRTITLAHDWRGCYVAGTVMTDNEETEALRAKFNIPF